MSVIFARAPLRITLGGGGTDIPAYYRRHGGFAVGAAIDKYIYMLVHTAFQRHYRLKHTSIEEVDDPAAIEHPILRATLQRHWRGGPLELASVSDVPAGTGLGSSGAYTVCALKSLALAARRAIAPEQLAAEACVIELDVLHEPIGKQDQYISAYGGICAYSFHPDDRVEVDPLELEPQTLDLLAMRSQLFFTGSVRSASGILADQVERTERGDPEVIENLHETKRIALETRDALVAGDLDRYAALVHEHWESKRQRGPGIATEHVDSLYAVARESGAIGGRLIGAGGAGFLLVYSPRPDDTRAAMAAAGAPELRFAFEFQGAIGAEYG